MAKEGVIKMSEKENVLVIEKIILETYIGDHTFNLITEKKEEVFQLVIDNHTFLQRDLAEYDLNYKQAIPYILIQHQNQYLLLKRTKKQTEKRLHNKFSLGIGGHINPRTESEYENVIIHGLYKELHEEISITPDHQLQFIGVINDETTDVSKVHLGLLYVIELEDGKFEILEKEKMSGEWVTVEELEENYDNLETWSQIVYRDYIGQE